MTSGSTPSSPLQAGLTAIPRSAYVHVPFCIHRCGYCDFTVIADRDDLIDAYVAALEIELRSVLARPHVVDTLFLGGGTPTYLPPDALDRLLRLLASWLPVTEGGEFTVEANPEGLDPSRLQVLRAGGVNRVSLGVQSFSPAALQLLERQHTPETVEVVVASLRDHGFTNLSLDLIYGVPGQTLADWSATLRRAVDLAPEHLSTYGLTFEKGTAFWSRRRRQELLQTPEEVEREQYSLAMDFLPEHGFEQYELSNFARPDARCRHNLVYWDRQPFFGFGPGAAALCDVVRTINHRSVTVWLKRLQSGKSSIAERDELTVDQLVGEAALLGFRRVEGIDRCLFESRFGRSVRSLAQSDYDRFLEIGWLEESETHVRLSREGRFVADSVLASFVDPPPR